MIAVLVLVVAGCGGEVVSRAVRASGVPSPPMLPAEAGVDSGEGASAAAVYWLTAGHFLLRTGNLEPFMAISTPSCGTCTATVEHVRGIYDRGAHIEGDQYTITVVSVDHFNPHVQAIVTASYQHEELVQVEANGDRSTYGPARTVIVQFDLRWSDESPRGWRIVEVDDIGIEP